MADVTKIFKPRRGKKSTMAGTKATTVLSVGELFVEVPDTGAGTGHSMIKMGDGTTAYSSLPYAIGDTSNDTITFTSDASTTATAALNNVVSGAALKTLIAGLKQAVSLNASSISTLNTYKRSTNNNTFSNLELSSSTPFIDFHYGSSTADYTSRIIENTSGTLDVEGNLVITGTLSSPTLDTMQSNFQAGCSTIASAITAQGVSTASNASPSTMASNITTACNNKYNSGYAAGDIKHTISVNWDGMNAQIYIDGTEWWDTNTHRNVAQHPSTTV
jgi:hypothetical protein